jgi:hypothetical protein
MHRSDPRPETVKIPDSPGSFKPRSLDTTPCRRCRHAWRVQPPAGAVMENYSGSHFGGRGTMWTSQLVGGRTARGHSYDVILSKLNRKQ